MAKQSILPQGISFDTTGDESELINQLRQNKDQIMILKDKELMEKQKEFFEKVREIRLAKYEGERKKIMMAYYDLLRSSFIQDVDASFKFQKWLNERVAARGHRKIITNEHIKEDYMIDTIIATNRKSKEIFPQQLLQRLKEQQQLKNKNNNTMTQ